MRFRVTFSEGSTGGGAEAAILSAGWSRFGGSSTGRGLAILAFPACIGAAEIATGFVAEETKVVPDVMAVDWVAGLEGVFFAAETGVDVTLVAESLAFSVKGAEDD